MVSFSANVHYLFQAIQDALIIRDRLICFDRKVDASHVYCRRNHFFFQSSFVAFIQISSKLKLQLYRDPKADQGLDILKNKKFTKLGDKLYD